MITAEKTATHATFVIERSFPNTPEQVFAAFADPAKKRRWFGSPNGADEFEMDFRVGGRERTRRRITEDSPVKGAVFTNDSTYQDIVPDRRIVIAYTMSMNDQRISASLITFELVAAGKGTDLIFTEQAAFFEGADGAQMRQGGWTSLLDKLAAELARS